MKLIVRELLTKYLEVEQLFQNGHFDKCVETIRRDVKDIDTVVALIFSHAHVQRKNQLVIRLIVSLLPLVCILIGLC